MAIDPQQTEQELTDVADLSYEEARQELIDLVARLEGGQAGLEESMRLWQRGEALAAHCEAWLDKAEASLSPDAAAPPSSATTPAPTDSPTDD
ncbi:exodeoxyribonuclease VII small subunit [Janibacter terrae]|uniref:Exodeoxyribonuclease 7 small subunit n=1 Tax=Janibacter terrae TaxID=103817 RepID=A0ABZ2FHY4_9MICO